MTLTALLRRLGVPAVPHGFRSSFTDWADEQWPELSEAADKALAHEEKSKTRRAYRRTDLFKPRIGLMQNWAGYVAETADSHHLKDVGEWPLTQRESDDRDVSVGGEVVSIGPLEPSTPHKAHKGGSTAVPFQFLDVAELAGSWRIKGVSRIGGLEAEALLIRPRPMVRVHPGPPPEQLFPQLI